MDFHFISIVKGGYINIIDPDGKSRILCFSCEYNARNCVNYVSRYRSTYGVWPDLNLNDPMQEANFNMFKTVNENPFGIKLENPIEWAQAHFQLCMKYSQAVLRGIAYIPTQRSTN